MQLLLISNRVTALIRDPLRSLISPPVPLFHTHTKGDPVRALSRSRCGEPVLIWILLSSDDMELNMERQKRKFLVQKTEAT